MLKRLESISGHLNVYLLISCLTSFLAFSAVVPAQAQQACLKVFEEKVSSNETAHSTAAMTFAGPWRFSPSALNKYGRNADASTVGDYKITSPLGFTYTVRDLQYSLGEGKVGLRLIPTVDNTPGNKPSTQKTNDGQVLAGSTIVDHALAEAYGMPTGQDKPLFAFMTYTHMEKNAHENYMAESRTTHMGGYIGKNQTRNAPISYVPQGRWKNSGYPAHMTTLKLKGVKPEVLNANAEISLSLLNKLNDGVIFPEHYKFDYYRMINLEEVLAYWRGWNDPSWERFPGEGPYLNKLKSNPTYHCYCAEHITLAANVAINVPHNLDAYKKIWGDMIGADLFAKVMANYKQSLGADLPAIENFKTVWERDGIKKPTEEKEVGKALAWHPLTTADLVYGVLSQYSTLEKAGALISSMGLLKLASEAKTRMGVAPEEYFKMTFPVIVKMWQFESLYTFSQAKTKEAFEAEFTTYLQSIPASYSAITQKLPSAEAQAINGMLVPLIVESLKKSSPWIQAHLTSDKDYMVKQFNQAVLTDLEQARKVKPKYEPDESLAKGERYVAYYSPPFILSWIQNGYARKHAEVEIKTVFTTVPASEVVYDNTNPNGISLERTEK